MDWIVKIFETTDLMTIIAMSIIGFFLYNRATRSFKEQINQSNDNLKELIKQSNDNLREMIKQSDNNLKEMIKQSETNLKDLLITLIDPIKEQVYNHIPTQIREVDRKFDQKFDRLLEILIDKDKAVEKSDAKEHEKPV